MGRRVGGGVTSSTGCSPRLRQGMYFPMNSRHYRAGFRTGMSGADEIGEGCSLGREGRALPGGKREFVTGPG